jgi:hypothetical protein
VGVTSEDVFGTALAGSVRCVERRRAHFSSRLLQQIDRARRMTMHVVTVRMLCIAHTCYRVKRCTVGGHDVRVTFEVAGKCTGYHGCSAQRGSCRDQLLDQVKVSVKEALNTAVAKAEQHSAKAIGQLIRDEL